MSLDRKRPAWRRQTNWPLPAALGYRDSGRICP